MRPAIPALLATLALAASCLAAGERPALQYWGRDEAEMVEVPKGEFEMGSLGGATDETPPHPVWLDALRIDKHEVTNRRYAVFEDWMKKHGDHSICAPGEPPGKDHSRAWVATTRPAVLEQYRSEFRADAAPVVGVDWFDAAAFAAWCGKRLPTEAEWERAAGGTRKRAYPWGKRIDHGKANYGGEKGRTMEVGAYPDGASETGCLDMAGNVWEWCHDWYGRDWYARMEHLNPVGPDEGEKRVLRGGSWIDFGSSLRTTFRGGAPPLTRSSHVGFRCVR